MSLSNKIAVEIPQDMVDKIKYLCKSIPKVEWSGVLFYEVIGSIKDTANMKIILKDILMMDIGTSGYTSFEWDEDVVNYQMDNPEAMEWKIGHIHSHNTMNVFFSGTDWSELNDNCPNHNFYLSVIVNNYLDVTAKIAFTAESQKFICKDENGKDYTLTITNTDIKPVMLVYDCEISMPVKEVVVPEAFAGRIGVVEEKIKAIKEKERLAEEKRKAEAAKNNSGKGKTYYDGFKEGNKKSPFPDYTPKQQRGGSMEDAMMKEFMDEMGEDFDDEQQTMQTIEQEFATYVIRLGNDELPDDELVDALEDVEGSNLNPQSFAASIMQSYGAYYERFFDKLKKYHGDEAFMEVLEEVIDIYSEFERDYPFLTPIVESLKELGIKFENFTKEQAS